MTVPFVIIADPASLRYQHLVKAIHSRCAENGTPPVVHCINWRDVCANDGRISHLLPDGPAILRIESPARDNRIARALMRAGQREQGVDESEWTDDRTGWIASPRFLFLGLQSCLIGIEESLDGRQDILSPADTGDIVTLFDKNQTSAILSRHGLPVPEQIVAPHETEQLLSAFKNSGWPSAFVKLAHGSCASGIAVLQPSGDQPSAVTTVQEIDGRFYNTFNVRTVYGDDARSILSFILTQGATVQRAIPKSKLNGRNLDLRIVVSHDKVIATICRISEHPMTNLHLGGIRGDIDSCRRSIPKRRWLDGLDACIDAASLFNLPCVGIDLAFDRTTFAPQIIEMNAFGDFFPNWVNSEGRSIHDIQIAQLTTHWNQHLENL